MHLLAGIFFLALLLGLAMLLQQLFRDNLVEILAALRCEEPPRRRVKAAVRVRPSVPRTRHAAA